MQIDRDGRFARQCAVGLWVGEREVNERARPLLPTDDTRRCKLSYESTVTIDLYVRYKALLSP